MPDALVCTQPPFCHLLFAPDTPCAIVATYSDDFTVFMVANVGSELAAHLPNYQRNAWLISKHATVFRVAGISSSQAGKMLFIMLNVSRCLAEARLLMIVQSCCSLQCLVDNQCWSLDSQALLHPLPQESSPMLLRPQLLIKQHLASGFGLPTLQHQHPVKTSSQVPMALQQATIDQGLHNHTLCLVHLVLGDIGAAEDDRYLV